MKLSFILMFALGIFPFIAERQKLNAVRSPFSGAVISKAAQLALRSGVEVELVGVELVGVVVSAL